SGGGEGRRHRGIGEAGARIRLPLHRPALRADHSRRGRAAAACTVCSFVVGGGTTFAGTARRGSPSRGRRDGLRLHRGFARPRAHRNAHHHVGRGRQGVAGGRVAGPPHPSPPPRPAPTPPFPPPTS